MELAHAQMSLPAYGISHAGWARSSVQVVRFGPWWQDLEAMIAIQGKDII